MVLCLCLCCTYYTGIAWFCIDIALLAVLHLLHWYCAFGCVAPITLVLLGFAMILRPWVCCSQYTDSVCPCFLVGIPACVYIVLGKLYFKQQWFSMISKQKTAAGTLVLQGFAVILRPWVCCSPCFRVGRLAYVQLLLP